MAKVFGILFRIITIFLIFDNFNFCATAEYEKSISYVVDSDLPQLNAYDSSIVLLRSKRQTPTDLKNKYQSVPQNATNDGAAGASMATPSAGDATASQPAAASSPAGGGGSALKGQDVVVAYNASEHPPLGFNGTGQRKVMPMGAKATVVSDPIQLGGEKKPSNQYPKKVVGLVAPEGGETDEDRIIDTVDVPDNETISDVTRHNYTVNMQQDHHIYYNSTLYVNKQETDQIWNRISNISHNTMLSQSHRRAMTVELTFDFPFYGHAVRNITVATGGFLYTGEYVHSWLAATQYIAPLMANFDTSLSNESFVRLYDNGTAFTVIWEKVSLQDKPEVGVFTFSTTLHKNGDIVFTYFSVPVNINAIQDDKHPVKVGLSDAYIIDKVVYFTRRKTIYEYHRINFGSADITNATIIHLNALTTCLQFTDCAACINHGTSFDCAWCPVLKRCSTGTDRKKHEWLQKGCDRAQITNLAACPAIGEKGNNANQTGPGEAMPSPGTQPDNGSNQGNNNSNSNGNNDNTTNRSNSNTNNEDASGGIPHPGSDNDNDTANGGGEHTKAVSKEAMSALAEHDDTKNMGQVMGFLVPIGVLLSVMLWVLYAYRNPHTKSGQLLIQYRPGTWSWRRGEARYTAATIHM